MTHAIARPANRVHGALYVTPESVPGTDQPALTFKAADAQTWASKAEAVAARREMLSRGYRVVEVGSGPRNRTGAGLGMNQAGSLTCPRAGE